MGCETVLAQPRRGDLSRRLIEAPSTLRLGRIGAVGANSQFFGRNYQAARPTAPQLPGMKRETANIDIRVEPTEGYTWRVE